MNIDIREAKESDIEELVRCHRQFMEHHINVDKHFTLKAGVEEKWKEQINDSVINSDNLVLIAEVNSNIVGCAYTLIRNGALDFGPEKIGYLCDVFVEPDYRRRGIAKGFLLSSQRWLLKKGIHTIEASWSLHSVEAQNTWPSLGFVPISISGQLEF